jgi:hypothetical protein
MPIRLDELALQELDLVEQEADLEGDLHIEFGDRDRVGGRGLEPLGPRVPKLAVAPAAVRAPQRRGRDGGSLLP